MLDAVSVWQGKSIVEASRCMALSIEQWLGKHLLVRCKCALGVVSTLVPESSSSCRDISFQQYGFRRCLPVLNKTELDLFCISLRAVVLYFPPLKLVYNI